VGGRLARPGSTGYHAAKWAVGGFHRISSTGSRAFWRQGVCPRTRGMRTNWGVRANKETPVLLSDYEPSVGAVIKALASYWGNEISSASGASARLAESGAAAHALQSCFCPAGQRVCRPTEMHNLVERRE